MCIPYKQIQKDKNLFAMLDTVVAWPVAWLRLAHRHHLLLALLLELNLETIVLVVVAMMIRL